MPTMVVERRDLGESLKTIDKLLKEILPEVKKGKDKVVVAYRKEEDLEIMQYLLSQDLMKGYLEGVLKFEYKQLGKEYKGSKIGYNKKEDSCSLVYIHSK